MQTPQHKAKSPKVSIIIPTLNRIAYIKECVDSALAQSLRDIEIICVDANSTDGTLEILQDYAKQDSCVRVIISECKSYGYQVNLGISQAQGEYIGIVESDDYAKPQMYEKLYKVAKAQDCDITKSDILCFHTANGESRFAHTPIVKHKRFYGKRLDFDSHSAQSPNATKSTKAKTAFLKSAWKMNQSSIFKREFLARYNIAFNETAGASYQDTGFSFIATICANSMYVLNEAYYCYRTDNEASSSNSKDKVWCLRDEYEFIEQFLRKNGLWSAYQGLFFYLTQGLI